MDSFKEFFTKWQYLIGLALISSAVLFFQNSRDDVVDYTEPQPKNYQHSLKQDGEHVWGYRTPSASTSITKFNETNSPFASMLGTNSSPEQDLRFRKNSDPDSQMDAGPSYANSDDGDYSSQPRNYSRDDFDNSRSAKADSKKSENKPDLRFFGGPFMPAPKATTPPTVVSGAAGSGTGTSATPTPLIQGRVRPLTGQIASYDNDSLISSAYAAGPCVDARILLMDMTSFSVLMDNPLAINTISGDADFSFDPVPLGLDLTKPSNYLLTTTGCTPNYHRIVTDFYAMQMIDEVTTLISKMIYTRDAATLSQILPKAIEGIYTEVEAKASTPITFQALYTLMRGDVSLMQKFQETFNVPVMDLEDAAPDIDSVTYFTNVNEGQVYDYKIRASHWNSGYTVAQEWQVNGVTKSTNPDWSYRPNGNSPAGVIVSLIIGRKNANNAQVDRSFPYHDLQFIVGINNTILVNTPIVQLADLSKNPSLTRNLDLEIWTGPFNGEFHAHCESFSHLAITENNTLPLASDFTISCHQDLVQSLIHSLQTPGDGFIGLSVWARDIRGNISAPFLMNIDLDTTAPVIQYNQMQAGYTSDSSATFHWLLTEAHSSNTQNFEVEFFDGTTWTALPDLAVTNGPHVNAPFSTTLNLPNINVSNAQLKLTYEDTLGQQTIATSAPFKIIRPILSANPMSLDLGTVLNKATTAEFTINFLNTGEVNSRTCQSLSFTGVNAAEFSITQNTCSGAVIAANGSCGTKIKATPISKGTRSANLELLCGNDSVIVPLTLISANNVPVVANSNYVTFEDTTTLVNLGSIYDLDGELLNFNVTAASDGGALSGCSTGTGSYICTYTPALNFNGTETLNFVADDGIANSNTGTLSVNVLAVNDAPTLASPMTLTTAEDTQLNFSLVLGADVDNNPLTYTIVSAPTKGSLTCTGVSCVYVPQLDFNGIDSFTYEVSDGSLTSPIATASITVNSVNDAPVVAGNESFSTAEDTAVNFSFAPATDIDLPAQTLSYRLVSGPSHGTLTNCFPSTYNLHGSCTYTPNNNYTGSDSFTYVAYDGITESATAAQVNMTISAVNDAPVASNINPASFNEDTVSTITLSYTDIENDQAVSCSLSALTNISVTTPCSCTTGICTVGVKGTLDYNGIASFNYTVADASLSSNTATASLNILAVDDAPVSNNITPPAFDKNTPEIITLSYSDVESHQAATCSVNNLTNVFVTTPCACAAGVCRVTVQSNFNFRGAGSFTYGVTANGLTSNISTATLTVNNTFTPPVANDIAPAALTEDIASIVTLNYTDIDADLATTCNITSPSNVTVTQACACDVAGICTVGVKGLGNYNGSAGFSYRVTSDNQSSNVAVATLTISPVDDAPVANNMTPPAFNEDIQSIITLSYGDVEFDQATVCQVSNPIQITVTTPCTCTMGTCTVGVTGVLNHNGLASFDYTVSANGLTSNLAAASLTLTAVDDSPLAINFTAPNLAEDTPTTINLQYSDIENDNATSCAVSGLSNISVTQACACAAGACTVEVKGNTNYNGAASFNFTVSSNGLTSNSAIASLMIDAGDDAPVASNITPSSFNEDLASTITLSYTDPENDQATTCSLSALSNISITQACVCAAGVCSAQVKGLADYNGAASFNYTVTSNGLTSNVASAALTITPVNDVPVANDITPPAFNEDIASVITLSYTDTENDQATICTITSPSNVSVSTPCACAAGSCTVGVTGVANYNGAGSFSYTITANSQTSNLATATLSLTPVDDAPLASNISPAAFPEDTATVITLAYTDIENDAATTCSVSSLSNISVTQPCACAAGLCTVEVQGTNGYNGAAGFDYTVSSNGLTSPSASAALTITPVNDPPVAANISPIAFNEDIQSIITLSYADPELDQASVCVLSNLSQVTVTSACACAAGVCTVGVTGLSNFNGIASFDYMVTANGQVSNAATASLSITAVDDNPVAANFTPANLNEDTASFITLQYSDIESHQAVTCSTSSLSNVSVTTPCACAAGVCTVEVKGTSNYNGAASIAYTVTANGLISNTATISLLIDADDDAPVANNLTASALTEDTAATITLSYTDPENDQAASCTVTGPTNITVSTACSCAAGVCTVGVQGLADYNGAASFTYTVTSNALTSNTAVASLTINPADDAPVATNLTPVAFNEDIASTITLAYTDNENDQATLCTLSGLSNVTVTTACACAAGVCTVGIKGTTNFYGNAAFNYTVTANGLVSNSASAALTINPVDDTPVANNITPASFNEDTASTITLSYSDIENDQAVTCSTSALSNIGIVTPCACAAGVCSVQVQGSLGYDGVAGFDYTVTANGLTSAAASASLTITPVDDAPVAINLMPAAFNEDIQSLITLNYTDAENDLAATCTLSNLSNITVSSACSCVAGICTVGVTGNSNYNGIASFDYTVTANGQASNVAMANLNINPVDDTPVAQNFTAPNMPEDTATSVTLQYTDTESDLAATCSTSTLTNISVTSPCACAAGVCTVEVKGNTNYGGPGSFNFTITANGLTSAAATASFTIDSLDDAPVASNITPIAFNEDTASIITLSYTDPESDQASLCSVIGLTNISITTPCACAAGTCTVGVQGLADYNGAASFSYTVSANSLISNVATAALTISQVNDAPVAVALTPVSFNEDTASTITLSYTDTENDQATVCSLSALSNITVTTPCACASGVCTVGVKGNLDYNGAASFNYTVTANSQVSNSSPANFTIDPIDDAPVANNITPASFTEDTASSITLSYSDVENNQAVTCAVSGPSNVTVTNACACAAGICTVEVTGVNGYDGAAAFNYTVTANGLTSNIATATLSITPVDDAPVAINLLPAAFNEDTQSVITLNYTDPEFDSATVCTLSNLSQITITSPCACVAGICSVGVTGLSNYNGVASFDYTVTANGQASNIATANLTVSPVDDAPVAQNFTPANMPEDTATVVTLQYTDVESDQAASCTTSALSNISVTTPCACAAGICTVEVKGNTNYGGAASFNFTVTANSLVSNSGTASFVIDAADDAPVASNITPAAFNEDTASTITLSYTDPENDQAATCSVTGLSNVTITSACACAAGICTVGVQGLADYSGTAGFTYTVTANGLASNPATAALTISPVNDSSVAANITPAAFNEDTQSMILLSYTDTENDLATVCSLSGLTNVSVSTPCACTAGVCSVGVTGTANYNGAASFSYTVTSNSQVSNSATASLTLTPVDDAPVAINITPASFNEDTAQVITLSYNDIESNNAATCTVSALTNITVTNACACAAGICSVEVKGLNAYNGSAGFNYTVTANGLTSNSASAALTITAEDDAPVASNISPIAFNEDIASTITLSYTDAENDQATICTVSGLSNITLSTPCACAAGVCTVGVTGTSNYNGSASFSYTVTANGLASNSASAALTITAVDDAPVAVALTPASFNEDTQSIITLSYSDVDSDQATICSTTALSNITVTQACACAAGICTVGVTGGNDYNGAASFNYTVTANGLTSNSVAANVTILGVNDAPVANNITPAAFDEDIASSITLSYTDTENDQATTCTITSPSNVTVTTPCSCTAGLCTVGVKGTQDYNGTGSFTYTVTAGAVSNSATASLTISAVNDAPVASNISPAAFSEDTDSSIVLSYTDIESDQATTCSIAGLSNVTVTQACLCASGICSVTVKGTPNYNGAAAFTYSVTANGLTSNSANASLTINNTDDAPVATNITPVAMTEDTAATITLAYTDLDSDQASSCAISGLSNVTVTSPCACAAGVCTVGVKGTNDYVGAAGFSYTVTANAAVSNSATATLTINQADDAPVATNISPVAFNEDVTSTITLAYTDPENDQASLCTVSGLTNVTVTNACACAAGVCTVGVKGLLDYTGSASFTYTVTANSLVSNTATASLTINNTDDAPIATNISPVAFNEDTSSTITLAYTDLENDQATTCSVAGLSNVTVTTACSCAAGVCTTGVKGTTNYNGAAAFTYTVTANGGTSNSATATLSILPIDDAPVASNITPPSFGEDTVSTITLAYTDLENDQAVSCSTSSLSNIIVTSPCACAAGVCTVGVKGTSFYNGPASFNFNVTANGQTSASALASLTITSVDNAPVATNITPAAFNEDTASTILLAYTDQENDQATTCSTSSLSNITVTTACACAAGVCSVGVKGTNNYNGAAGFSYTVTANGLTSNSASATLSILPGDDAPVATNISPVAFNEDTASSITLAYTDLENDQATSCSVASPTNITVSTACACAAGICTVGVTGASNHNGSASFAYTVTAGSATSNSATASLTISPVDDAPLANNITPPAFNENATSVITLSYTDPENDQAGTCTISGLSNVTVTQACSCLLGTCTVGVRGVLNYNGIASFQYTVTTNALTSNSATASLTISSVDSAPVAANISPAAFAEDVASTIVLSYSDVENDQATTCSLSSLSNVTITQPCFCSSGICTVEVKGTANYNGAASFAYTVTANSSVSNAATASLTITPVNDAPVATNVTPTSFGEDTQKIVTLAYTDVDNDQASSCTVTSPTNVTVTQACACAAGVCTVGVTGTNDYTGAASFSYTVTANTQTSNSATASLTITGVDDAPVALNITPAAFNEDTSSTITLSYTDKEFDQATSCTVSGLTNVTITSSCACSLGTCSVGVRGTSNYNGIASFTYTVTANMLVSNAATASLTVTSVDDTAVATNITPAAFNEDTQSIMTLSYTDSDNDQATACTLSSLNKVTVTQACACAAGVCTVGVTGTANANGAAGFSYTVTTNGAPSNTATSTFSITAIDDAPVAANITPASFGSTATNTVITLSYTDVESDQATTCAISGLSNLTISQACACSSGICTVGVKATSTSYNGAASFNYTVTANGATSNSATASTTVTMNNTVPSISATTTTYSTSYQTPTIPMEFTINDAEQTLDCSSTNLSMTSSNTTLVPNANVVWSLVDGSTPPAKVCAATVTPANGQSGTTSLTITVNDGAGGTATQVIALTVQSNNIVAQFWATNPSLSQIVSTYNMGCWTSADTVTRTIQVRNVGTVTANSVTVAVANTRKSAFSLVTPNSCTSVNLAPYTGTQTCQFTVQWRQTQSQANTMGLYNGTATITSGTYTSRINLTVYKTNGTPTYPCPP